MIISRTAVVTGPPGAGKTALIDELARRGLRTVAEAARAILRGTGGMALRAGDPLGFARAMLVREVADLAALPDDGEWTIFDRGIGDSLGFLRLAGLDPPTELKSLATSSRYSGPVFLAPAWQGIFHGDAERVQTWSEALVSGEAVAAAWRALGYDLIELPRISPEARADFVEAELAAR